MRTDAPNVPHDCRPVGELLLHIGGKWTTLIVLQLSEGPIRFSALKRAMGDVTQKVLTATLRELEMDGFIERTVTPSNPPRVDYALTPLGYELLQQVRALGEWAHQHRSAILKARARYAQSHPEAPARRAPNLASPAAGFLGALSNGPALRGD